MILHSSIMIGILPQNQIMLTPGVVLVRVMARHGMTRFHSYLHRTFVSVHETFLHVRISEEYSGSDDQIFFGLTDQANDGTFIWIDGTPLQYSSWRSDQPNDYNGQDCATLTPTNPDMGWVDVSCNGIRPFICERYQGKSHANDV
eukprot:XP_011667894.1 PREDICTED: C-type lectin 1-like [Strongylocentrotus purpuratus]